MRADGRLTQSPYISATWAPNMIAAAIAAIHTISDTASRTSPRHKPINTETTRMATMIQSAQFMRVADRCRDGGSSRMGHDQAVELLAGLEFLAACLGIGAPDIRPDADGETLAPALDVGRESGRLQPIAELLGIG